MIETARLTLRPWRAEDAAAHHAIVSDPRVRVTLGAPPPREEAARVVERQNAILAAHGYCFWAAEERATGAVIGWCGLKPGKPPIEGEMEIGWTLAADRWGRGLAREAAEAALAWGWANTDAPHVAAITAAVNGRSAGLMERLGMSRVLDADFDHPDLAPGDRLRRHVLYRIARPA